MKINSLVLALIAAVVPVNAAHASNPMILLGQSDLNQLAVLDISGAGNRLAILREGAASEAGSRLSVSIKGDSNGGPLGSRFTGRPATLELAPGSLAQVGFGNSIDVAVTGEGNLFAVSQLGNNNAVMATLHGSDNQAAIAQVGVGNFTSVAQTGVGNSVSVQQTSW